MSSQPIDKVVKHKQNPPGNRHHLNITQAGDFEKL